jgi:hypothetical protein
MATEKGMDVCVPGSQSHTVTAHVTSSNYISIPTFTGKVNFASFLTEDVMILYGILKIRSPQN